MNSIQHFAARSGLLRALEPYASSLPRQIPSLTGQLYSTSGSGEREHHHKEHRTSEHHPEIAEHERKHLSDKEGEHHAASSAAAEGPDRNNFSKLLDTAEELFGKKWEDLTAEQRSEVGRKASK